MAARRFLGCGDSGGSAVDGGGGSSFYLDNTRAFCSSKPLDSFFVIDSRSMVSFEDKRTRSSSSIFNQQDNVNDEYEDYFHHPEKKRRLKADQIQFLEKSFETENKLEPERKIQLAKELGLHPRQIAIWFQNRRARWKNKQLEKDYDTLQENYNQLKANYDNLHQEKERLKTEVVDLSYKLLQQENEKGTSNSSTTKFPSFRIQQEPVAHCVNEDQYVSRTSHVAFVQDVVSDSSSPEYIHQIQCLLEARVDLSYLFVQDQSDESFDEEDNTRKMFVTPVNGCILPKIRNGDHQELDAVNSCYLEFHDHDHNHNQDQSFCFWSY